MFASRLTLNCRGKLLSLEEPRVMGILNVTPDSFYDGGSFTRETAMLRQVEKMLEQGAGIIDVGGMSSRPGAQMIPENEELDRVVPVIEAIVKNFPGTIISIDSVQPAVVKKAIEAGADMVNDISAGRFHPQMYSVIAKLEVPYILMHMQGEPGNMQENPHYENPVQEVLDFFIRETGKLRALGVKDIVLDVGFGFGKTVEHNYLLLKKLHVFKILELPLLAGLSRKSMINKVLEVKPSDALNGTTALHMVALQQGAKILRVHDVGAAMEVIKLWQQLEKA